MDHNLAIQHLLLNEDEAEHQFDDDEQARFLATAIITGSEVSRQDCIDTRHPNCLYLCRPQLLPNPHINTPWQVLYNSQNDRAFITTMGVDVSTFSSLLTAGFAKDWYKTPIPRDDVSVHGNLWIHQRSLDAAAVLGLVLHYLSSMMHAISLQQIFAIIPNAKIQWPGGLDFERCSALVVACHGRLKGAFGSIDGLKLPVQTSEDVNIKNTTFNGWLSEHFISSVLVFSAEGVIIAARLNCPGSWHDSCHRIYASIRNDTPPGYYIVADTQGQHVQGSLAEIDEQMAFNRELLSYRQTAEWGMRGLQGAFGRLRVPLEITNKDSRGDLIEICVHLHNLRAICIGINQIQTVYLKHWQETVDDIAVWHDFENMLFSEQRKKDQVSHLHVALEFE
ncbi:hypothetical protein P692DRAFT_201868064 [Suillus brevipes Sb2]|nr:hypothetical protein P692DRAFT_201868064 [Suillus brevipes Sb2]